MYLFISGITQIMRFVFKKKIIEILKALLLMQKVTMIATRSHFNASSPMTEITSFKFQFNIVFSYLYLLGSMPKTSIFVFSASVHTHSTLYNRIWTFKDSNKHFPLVPRCFLPFPGRFQFFYLFTARPTRVAQW